MFSDHTFTAEKYFSIAMKHVKCKENLIFVLFFFFMTPNVSIYSLTVDAHAQTGFGGCLHIFVWIVFIKSGHTDHQWQVFLFPSGELDGTKSADQQTDRKGVGTKGCDLWGHQPSVERLWTLSSCHPDLTSVRTAHRSYVTNKEKKKKEEDFLAQRCGPTWPPQLRCKQTQILGERVREMWSLYIQTHTYRAQWNTWVPESRRCFLAAAFSIRLHFPLPAAIFAEKKASDSKVTTNVTDSQDNTTKTIKCSCMHGYNHVFG